MTELKWAPPSCTLPTVDQPLREQEFSALFATSLRQVHQSESTRVELTFDSTSERVARDLAAKESSCCSFFTFEFVKDADSLQMIVVIPEQHAEVLGALVAAARHDAGLDTASSAA